MKNRHKIQHLTFSKQNNKYYLHFVTAKITVTNSQRCNDPAFTGRDAKKC